MVVMTNQEGVSTYVSTSHILVKKKNMKECKEEKENMSELKHL